MLESKNSQQSIGCEVNSCKYYNSNACTLHSIVVKPCSNCNTGKPEDETLCGSYQVK